VHQMTGRTSKRDERIDRVGFDFDKTNSDRITSKPYKSSGENYVYMNVFDAQMIQAKMIFHAEGNQTGLNLLVTEISWPPNNRTLPHIHELEDESFFMLKGSVTIHFGPPDEEREVMNASTGEFAWLPRNHWHEVNVGADGAHVLLIQTPGSQLSEWFRVVGTEIGTEIETEEDFDRLNSFAYRNYGLRFWKPDRWEGARVEHSGNLSVAPAAKRE
jgi:quercetin dioxygenase-like cupin family protein